MASYYYLMASLPMLRADAGPPFSYDRFLELCKGNVKPDRLRQLEELTINSTEGPLVREWAAFYGTLADELAFQRLQKLGRPAVAPASRDPMAVRAVTEALNARDPLEAEELLLKLEFSRLDSLAGTHIFDEEALSAYALKLRLLERQAAFNADAGRAEAKRILDSLRDQIFRM